MIAPRTMLELIRCRKYYHTDLYKRTDCEYCSFHQGLYLIYAEISCSEDNSIERLCFYCAVREERFVKTRIFLNRLAALERHRLGLEKRFNNILAKWNVKEKEDMISPILDVEKDKKIV